MKLIHPKPDTVFRRHNHRLALFHSMPQHVEYWKDYWNDAKRADLIGQGFKGHLGEFERIFLEHLPASGLILEAGCGAGHLVAALQARGYEVAGVDYERSVVDYLNREFPVLRIGEGNILALNLPDGSLRGYVSIGVVEHFEGGPLPALKEARRVLSGDGVALISVPHLNPLRSRFLGTMRGEPSGNDGFFHQYYYSSEEFSGFLREAGFSIKELFPYGVEGFLPREHPVFARLWRSKYCLVSVKNQLRKGMSLLGGRWASRYSHMMMYVCRPTEGAR